MLDIRSRRGPAGSRGSPEPVVPTVPIGTIPLLIGGHGDAGVRRAVRYGIGWTAGGAAESGQCRGVAGSGGLG